MWFVDHTHSALITVHNVFLSIGGHFMKYHHWNIIIRAIIHLKNNLYFIVLSLVAIASNSKPRPSLLVLNWNVMAVEEGFCWLLWVAVVSSYAWNISWYHVYVILLVIWLPCIVYGYDWYCCWSIAKFDGWALQGWNWGQSDLLCPIGGCHVEHHESVGEW